MCYVSAVTTAASDDRKSVSQVKSVDGVRWNCKQEEGR